MHVQPKVVFAFLVFVTHDHLELAWERQSSVGSKISVLVAITLEA